MLINSIMNVTKDALIILNPRKVQLITVDQPLHTLYKQIQTSTEKITS